MELSGESAGKVGIGADFAVVEVADGCTKQIGGFVVF
jgi:hypothetical protein